MPITVYDLGVLFSQCSRVASDNAAELCRADSLHGDGDLGVSLARGFAAVERIPTEGRSIAEYLGLAALAFNDAASSTCGTLCSIGLRRMSRGAKGRETLAVEDVIALLEGFTEAVMQKGGAQLGDKTFLDVVVPAVTFCKEQITGGTGAATWLPGALDVLHQAEYEARALLPKRGRARMFSDKAAGAADAGATAAVVFCTTLIQWLQRFS
jgi:dihydroxyacetone kinase-like protein